MKVLPNVLLILLLAGLLLTCDPLHTDIEPTAVEVLKASRRDTTPADDTLRVLSWNIQHGGAGKAYFYHCTAEASLAEASLVRENLNRMAALIESSRADVVFLQRIDRSAKRSAYIHQIQFLLDSTHLNYAAYTPLLHTDFLPYFGLGPTDTGVATLTRSKPETTERLELARQETDEQLPDYFQFRRALLHTTIRNGSGRTWQLFNVWLTPYPKNATKTTQLGEVYDYLKETGISEAMIAAGTFHTLPPGENKRNAYSDEPCINNSVHFVSEYSGEAELFAPFYNAWKPAIPPAVYSGSPAETFTFARSPEKPFSRKVDYVFSNQTPIPEETGTLQKQVVDSLRNRRFSDHAPVVTAYRQLQN